MMNKSLALVVVGLVGCAQGAGTFAQPTSVDAGSDAGLDAGADAGKVVWPTIDAGAFIVDAGSPPKKGRK